jgi:hypothetical protein
MSIAARAGDIAGIECDLGLRNLHSGIILQRESWCPPYQPTTDRWAQKSQKFRLLYMELSKHKQEVSNILRTSRPASF